MPINFRNKIAISGVSVLMIGVALLIFTFISAYGFLTQSLSIIASDDLIRTFGEALAPLIATCIRVMYLGVMGWIGSLLTIRGVTIIAHIPKEPKVILRRKAKAAPKKVDSQKEKPKPQPSTSPSPTRKSPEEVRPKEEPKEPEPQEPEVIFIPPEETKPQKVEQERQRENDSFQYQSGT